MLYEEGLDDDIVRNVIIAIQNADLYIVDDDIENLEQYEATAQLRINENPEYSKYKLLSLTKGKLLKEAETTEIEPIPTLNRETEETNTNIDLTEYIGVWYDTLEYDELTIKNISGNKVTFDWSIYRLATFENIIADLKGNVATFKISRDKGVTEGKLTFTNNLLGVEITNETGSEFVGNGYYLIFDKKMTLKEYEKNMEEQQLEGAVKYALQYDIAQQEGVMWDKDSVFAEAHEILGTEIKNNQIYVYVYADIRAYKLKNNQYEVNSSMNALFAIILNNDYSYAKYLLPGDGEGYGGELEKIFPADVIAKMQNIDLTKEIYQKQFNNYLD